MWRISLPLTSTVSSLIRKQAVRLKVEEGAASEVE